MRALVIHAPHDLRIDDVPVVQPGAGEVKVRVRMGGICGSDLHYFHNGGFGAIRIREPMSLGHEVAGTVTAVGSGVTCVAVGDKVAVNPSKPCGHCRFCIEGDRQQCLDMRFFGSAMRFPHLQGAFREELIIDETQAVKVLPDTPFEEAVFSEPLSVALHAVSGAGSLVGKRVLVTGTGTIGCLVIACARYAGAAEIVATDVADNALVVAAKMGADRTVNVASEPAILEGFTADKGYFDAAFECSGNGGVIASLTQMVRPRGAITLNRHGRRSAAADQCACHQGTDFARQLSLRPGICLVGRSADAPCDRCQTPAHRYLSPQRCGEGIRSGKRQVEVDESSDQLRLSRRAVGSSHQPPLCSST